MKKYYIKFAIFLFLAFLFAFLAIKCKGYFFNNNGLDDVLYINTQFEKNTEDFDKIKRLSRAFDEIGVKVEIKPIDKHKSGKYNLYVAENKTNLPKVLDLDAINVLWVPYVDTNTNIEMYRDFDVIVVKSNSSFTYLKAINARTAFIPDAIDMKKVENKTNNRILYYGDNRDFSLAMYLTKNYDIDIIGKGWKHTEFYKKVKKDNPSKNDFSEYFVVLVDQSDEEIANYILSKDFIKVLENGGVPVIRFNPGVSRLFDDRVIMYHNENDFHKTINELMTNKDIVHKVKSSLYAKPDTWNTLSVANKFTEIFQIMKKKRINQ